MPWAVSRASKSTQPRWSAFWFWTVMSKGACPSAAASMVRLRPMELAVMPIARSRRMQITVWDR